MSTLDTAKPAGSRDLGDPVISTRDLTKRYGDHVAVDRLNLTVHRGEVYGLLGPNGAGKTTTILMLLGLSEPTSGTATVLGMDPVRDPLGVKQRVGYLPDNVGFYGSMSGRQNLRYTARLNGVERRATEERIDRLLTLVGMAEAADAPVDTYSRGMRQRLGIADALVKEPDVLILDEPTIAIDPQGVNEILSLIRSLATEHGVALLLSSHLLHQVQSVCDRVGIFVRGRLVADGPLEDLARDIGESTVTLEVGADADPSRSLQALRRIPDVLEVSADGEIPGRWLVRASRDIRPMVARALVSDGIPILHLRRQGEQLDEIYRRYFQQ